MTNTANNRANNRQMWWLLVLGVAACGKEPAAVPPPPVAPPAAAVAVAGNVEAVEGRVTAQRADSGAAARILALHDGVWPDDWVVTADQASVAIRLSHNGALWQLEGGQTRRVDASPAWRAPKQAAQQALAERQEASTTASAGRHSEQEAAQTGEAAPRPEPAPAGQPEAAKDAGAPAVQAQNEARRKQLLKEIRKHGVLGVIGGNGKGDLGDVLGGGGGGDIDKSLQGMQGTAIGDSAGLGGLGIRGHGAAKRAGGLGSIGGGGTGSGVSSGQVHGIIAEVKLQPLLKKGEVKPAALAAFVAPVRARIRAAYTHALVEDPTLGGTLVVRVAIADGRVTDVTVLSGAAQKPLVDCLLRPLKAATLDGADGVTLELTVTFTRRD